MQDLTFVGADSSFTSLILGLYRNIEEQIMEEKTVYTVSCRLVPMHRLQ
ncbi:MAG: hypothetical protein ACLRL6_11830 [Clostridium sp.]